MANEQWNTNEVIAQLVAEAARVTTQATDATGAGGAENVKPRLGGPIMKQPTFKKKTKIMSSETSFWR